MAEDPLPPKRTIRQINYLVHEIVQAEMHDDPVRVEGTVRDRWSREDSPIIFKLQRDSYSIHCIIPQSVRHTVINVENGQEVSVTGTVQIYAPRGELQIKVDKVELVDPQPREAEAVVFERLGAAGLWPKEKKPLTPILRTVALLTSESSKARRDFEVTYLKEAERENRLQATIKFVDVALYGPHAPHQIAEAIKRLNRSKEVDVIALVRGGGGDADLSVLNDYGIAEAICKSSIPVVTGIGHEPDISIADRVADEDQITPTAAASFLARHNPMIAGSDAPAQVAAKPRDYRLAALILLVIAGALAAVLIAVLISTAQ